MPQHDSLRDISGLVGRVALVSGAQGGMGKAITALLVAAGAVVVAGDVAPPSPGADRADQILPIELDVTKPADWCAALTWAEQAVGPVSILVNCAGLFEIGSLVDADLAQMERAIRVNQIGPALGIQAVVPSMRKAGGGAIVNIASNAAMRGFAGMAAYSASKWALRGLSRSAAAELAADNIRVNAIHPGAIDTAMLHVHSEEAIEQVRQGTPLRRLGTPLDVAKAVLFFASDLSSFITGTDLSIDGGLMT